MLKTVFDIIVDVVFNPSFYRSYYETYYTPVFTDCNARYCIFERRMCLYAKKV